MSTPTGATPPLDQTWTSHDIASRLRQFIAGGDSWGLYGDDPLELRTRTAPTRSIIITRPPSGGLQIRPSWSAYLWFIPAQATQWELDAKLASIVAELGLASAPAVAPPPNEVTWSPMEITERLRRRIPNGARLTVRGGTNVNVVELYPSRDTFWIPNPTTSADLDEWVTRIAARLTVAPGPKASTPTFHPNPNVVPPADTFWIPNPTTFGPAPRGGIHPNPNVVPPAVAPDDESDHSAEAVHQRMADGAGYELWRPRDPDAIRDRNGGDYLSALISPMFPLYGEHGPGAVFWHAEDGKPLHYEMLYPTTRKDGKRSIERQIRRAIRDVAGRVFDPVS